MNKFWSFDGEQRETHATAEEAQRACQRALDFYRNNAEDGWDDAVESIMWGPIAERIVEVESHEGHRPSCDIDDCASDCPVSRGFDRWVEYKLVGETS